MGSSAKRKREQILLTSGYNYIDLEYEIEESETLVAEWLWGASSVSGRVEVVCENHTEVYPAFSYGIRTIELNTDVIQGKTEFYACCEWEACLL